MTNPNPTAAAAEPAGLRIPAVWLAIGLALLVPVLFYAEFRELVARWAASNSDSHGFLVAPLVIYLIWVQRGRIHADNRGARLAALGIAGTALGIALAQAAAIDVGVWTLLPFALWFALWLALGTSAAAALAFPVFYFLFAVPITGYVTPVLQWLTVQVVTFLLGLVGQEAYIRNEYVTVPAGTFEIADGCAGTNYMVIALAIGTLLAFVDRLPWRRALVLVGFAALVAAVANWIRVTIIIYWGQVTAMQTSLIEDHYTFGWWIFAFSLVPVFFVARRLSRGLAAPAPDGASVATAPVGPRVWLAAVGLVLAGAWPWLIERRDAGPVPDLRMPALAGWSGPEAGDFDWQPSFPGAAAERLVLYRRDATTVDAYAAYFGRQGPGQKLIGYEARVTGEEGRWSEQSSQRVEVPGGGAVDAVTERIVVDSAGRERVLWSWYEVRGEPVLSARGVKLREGLAAFGLPRRSGILAVSARCVPDCAAARAVLGEAWSAGLAGLSAGTGPNRALAAGASAP